MSSLCAGLTERRLFMLLFLSFGVLCIIQAILNVSLRLTMYPNSRSPNCNTTHDGENEKGERQADCDRGSNDEFNRLQERFNALTRDKNQLENQNNELNNIIQDLQKQRDRLRGLCEGSLLSASKCPVGWEEINSKCYYHSSVTKTWEDSGKFCLSKEADLVVINNVEEQRALSRLVQNTSSWFWIGLYNSGRTFGWVDGSPLTYEFWRSGKPGNGKPNNPGNCVAMSQGGWISVPCGVNLRWLCEKATIK
ncbi:C-type lectin domain family 4 member M-like isoform X1 [Xyrichtys novacula]|uniref:C-type lectin domain family 4 member M-like isoform X1 n=1 Tax=Xyrichtys novacula TaxID=13765 RepID=A0AAV1EXV4_XYRNO|nr:C-type lectin domain family 4 member M-like isoform X1 [Xyrichtys novacula]